MQQKILEVLLIEDTVEDAELIAQTLQGYHPDIVVRTVHDGAAALDCLFGTGQYVAKGPYTPQLILLDLALPKVSGLQVLRVIRSYARTKLIPVVILSATSEERKVVESYQVGVSSYLVKPPEIDQFRQLIEEIAAYWLRVHMPSRHTGSGNAGSPSEEDDLTRPDLYKPV